MEHGEQKKKQGFKCEKERTEKQEGQLLYKIPTCVNIN